MAILPYYVANLNIEATYAAINGFEEYPNLCFVDTLDNTAALRTHRGHQGDLFGAVSEENVARIKRQNKRKISVIIGNPPYNANQLNENENNKNREYPEIDRRIKETYIAASTAQKTKLYDMYARFFRWASDRVDENGIVAFVSNRSFIDSRTFDGFRKMVFDEFNDVYIVDLGGDVRGDSRLSGIKNNVFGIQTGVAISFMVKRKAQGCRIRYVRRPQLETAEEKLSFLAVTKIAAIQFEEIVPNTRNEWINQSTNDFDSLVPIADKETKSAKVAGQERAIFKTFSFGVVTNRDDWVYSDDQVHLEAKVRSLISTYNSDCKRLEAVNDPKERARLLDKSIKWTRAVKRDLANNVPYRFNPAMITSALYRPFVRKCLYFSPQLNEMQNRMAEFFGPLADRRNTSLIFSDPTSQKPYLTLSTDVCPDMHLVGAASGSVTIPRLIGAEQAVDNITDWALDLFRARCEKRKEAERLINKDAIFHYVYGVLHDPIYREKYAQNLKREFPRVPFYDDFWRWAEWGKTLLELHVGYETVEPWSLERIDMPDEKSRKGALAPKAILKASSDAGTIQLDGETQITGVPPEAWTYKLGSRSALEWILDQYKEKTPKDPTVREKFNTYRFADHKEKVIDLLKRVTRVSMETMRIVEAMRRQAR